MALREKNSYWTRVIKDIEQKAQQQSKRDKIKKYNFAVTLPEKLRKRVAKIQPYEFDEFDKNIFIAEFAIAAPVLVEDNEEEKLYNEREEESDDFNGNNCSAVERLELEYPHFVFNTDKPLEHKTKKKTKKKHNWYSSYICKGRKERVRWDSKIYDMEGSMWEKTLDEQAEELMDASAERFTEWINSFGSKKDSNMTKEKIKALFSIEGDSKLLSSNATEPKEVKAIAKTVTDMRHLPEMSIELKNENYIRNLHKNIPKKIVRVAFGRTISAKDSSWIPEDCLPIKSIFPEELLTFEKMFKGITHLRSTKELVEFYKQRPNLEKPRYLVTSGLFKQKKEAETITETPLYERLKLKY